MVSPPSATGPLLEDWALARQHGPTRPYRHATGKLSSKDNMRYSMLTLSCTGHLVLRLSTAVLRVPSPSALITSQQYAYRH